MFSLFILITAVASPHEVATQHVATHDVVTAHANPEHHVTTSTYNTYHAVPTQHVATHDVVPRAVLGDKPTTHEVPEQHVTTTSLRGRRLNVRIDTSAEQCVRERHPLWHGHTVATASAGGGGRR